MKATLKVILFLLAIPVTAWFVIFLYFLIFPDMLAAFNTRQACRQLALPEYRQNCETNYEKATQRK